MTPAGEDQHSGADQLIPDVIGRAGIPRPRRDTCGLGQDVVAAVGDLAHLFDRFVQVRHRGRELWLVPPDELGECAVLATALLLLIEQGQVVAIEGVEPLLPVDVLQLVLSGIGWSANALAAARSLPATWVRTLMRSQIRAACTARRGAVFNVPMARADRASRTLSRLPLGGPPTRR